MPDINFNDTYDELSNLAVDPAEMKADEEPKKAKELKFIDLLKTAIKEKYGDIIGSLKQVKDLGLKDYTYSYQSWPVILNKTETIPDNLKVVGDLLQGLAYSKDIVYKIVIYYNPSDKDYSLKLFVDDNGWTYRQMSDWLCPADLIAENEKEISKHEKELSEFEARKAREKEAIEDLIEKDKKEIQFIKDHTQEDALKNRPDLYYNLYYKSKSRWV